MVYSRKVQTLLGLFQRRQGIAWYSTNTNSTYKTWQYKRYIKNIEIFCEYLTSLHSNLVCGFAPFYISVNSSPFKYLAWHQNKYFSILSPAASVIPLKGIWLELTIGVSLHWTVHCSAVRCNNVQHIILECGTVELSIVQ